MKFLAVENIKGDETWLVGNDKKNHSDLIPEDYKERDYIYSVSGKFSLDWDDSIILEYYHPITARDRDADIKILQAMESLHKTYLFIPHERTH